MMKSKEEIDLRCGPNAVHCVQFVPGSTRKGAPMQNFDNTSFPSTMAGYADSTYSLSTLDLYRASASGSLVAAGHPRRIGTDSYLPNHSGDKECKMPTGRHK